jgi:death-on-curing protein
VAEPVWIRRDAVLALHARSLALHGGAEGVRDEGLLESALQRPQNRHQYDGVDDPAELAATYVVGLAANHPFVDGNKRAAFACLLLFLRLNGRRLTADQVSATRMMFAVAAGEIGIEDLAAWIRTNSEAA